LSDTDSQVRDGMRTRFTEAVRGTSAPVPSDFPTIDLKLPQTDFGLICQLAREQKMSVDDVVLVKSVFDSFDTNRSGSLDVEEFEKAIVKLLTCQLQLADPKEVLERVKAVGEWSWWDGDSDHSGSIDFKEFITWYSSNGFSEDLLLTQDERGLRKIAKENNLSPDYVDMMKRYFDMYDSDLSGSVDQEEFKQILYKILKVPANFELPPSRIQYFWSEIDIDNSGRVTFEEFLMWYTRYFNEVPGRSVGQLPFEDYYKQVRRVGKKYLDPPAYSKPICPKDRQTSE